MQKLISLFNENKSDIIIGAVIGCVVFSGIVYVYPKFAKKAVIKVPLIQQGPIKKEKKEEIFIPKPEEQKLEAKEELLESTPTKTEEKKVGKSPIITPTKQI